MRRLLASIMHHTSVRISGRRDLSFTNYYRASRLSSGPDAGLRVSDIAETAGSAACLTTSPKTFDGLSRADLIPRKYV